LVPRCVPAVNNELDRPVRFAAEGEVPEDYVFERIGKISMPENVRMSELFGTQDTLILYSFMYGPEREPACPGCTHLLDGARRHRKACGRTHRAPHRCQIADSATRRR
jgi:predicted dithiol-disulfide oxidoreductase (DUF899 family)